MNVVLEIGTHVPEYIVPQSKEQTMPFYRRETLQYYMLKNRLVSPVRKQEGQWAMGNTCIALSIGFLAYFAINWGK